MQVCNWEVKAKDEIKSYTVLESPFRMQKINLVWEKARTHLNLPENKLAKLYSQLKLQDKEELTLKKLKAEGGDKAGLKEADVRQRFNQIMQQYGLIKTDKFKQNDNEIQKSKHIFKDKKLQKLWEKAEKSGLTSTELLALQQEFQHHQEKMDEYHKMVEIASNQNDLRTNEIQRHLSEEYNIRDRNELKKNLKDLQNNYEKLHKLTTGQDEHGFREPKVGGLWRIALEADFSDEELESLKQELGHYEKRLEKLRFLQTELELVNQRRDVNSSDLDEEKTEGRRVMDRKLDKSKDSVNKLHDHLEAKILARHKEL